MICKHCGAFFCNDLADGILTGETVPRQFCDKICARAHHSKTRAGAQAKLRRYRMRRKGTQVAHRRGKHHYPTEEEAFQALAEMQNKTFYPDAGIYRCCDEGFQVTRNLPARHMTYTIGDSLGDILSSLFPIKEEEEDL